MITSGGTAIDFITQSKDPILSFPNGARPKWWGHILIVENLNTHIQCRIQFFLGPDFDPLTHIIKITNEKLSIGEPKFRGHYFSYFEKGKQGRFYGEASNIECHKKFVDIR